MRVIVGCEFSQVVMSAFLDKGHDAYSCDIIACEGKYPERHFQCDILELLKVEKFDLGIFHPDCTHLTCAANKYFLNNPERWLQRYEAMIFVHKLFNADIHKICIENPKGVISSYVRKPDQYIQPYEFGDPAQKTTGLWLKNLPLLKPTNIVKPEIIRKNGYIDHPWHYGTNKKTRSIFWPGIAEAMSAQWS